MTKLVCRHSAATDPEGGGGGRAPSSIQNEPAIDVIQLVNVQYARSMRTCHSGHPPPRFGAGRVGYGVLVASALRSPSPRYRCPRRKVRVQLLQRGNAGKQRRASPLSLLAVYPLVYPWESHKAKRVSPL